MSSIHIFDWIFSFSYVESLIKKCHIPLESIKFIGHSLGAHVSGFAAKNIQKSGNISLIIAADPANPIFDPFYTSCEKRLCKSDAERLVVLHTSSLGISKSIGHLDLQFQNGMIQPGCGEKSIASNYYVGRRWMLLE